MSAMEAMNISTPVAGRGNPSVSTPGMRPSPIGQLPSPSSANHRLMKSVLSDKYILGEELGRGAYGQVFKGMDTRTGDCVAIKQLSLNGISSSNLQSIMLEIELLKNLNHKNIVKYIGSFKTRTHLYIILEYMENGSLASVIKPSKFGAFSESLVAVYIAQVLQGLSYLHLQGVVHRDIKGANILTTKEGVVKLADFGVAAKLTDVEDGGDNLRLSVVGTPYWMAPEVIEMTSVTAASDIWSVGCLAIELLTGQPPYFEHAPMSALFRIVQDEHPPLPPDISADMVDFLLACFHKNPQLRPDAATLLGHPWIAHHRRTLRASWTRTQGLKARGARTDAHASVATVVERILQFESGPEGSNGSSSVRGLPDLEPAISPLPLNSARTKTSGPGSSRSAVRDSAMDDASPPRTAARPGHDCADDSASEMSAMPPTVERPSPPVGDELEEGLEEEAELEPKPPDDERPRAAPVSQKSRPPALDQAIIDANSHSSLSTPTPVSDGGPTSLGGLLSHLGGPLPGSVVSCGEDLMAWLEERERVAGSAGLGLSASPGPDGLLDGGPSRHQEAAEVRRLAAALRPPTSRGSGAGASSSGGNSARETTVVDACQQLATLFNRHPERKTVFLADDGAAAVMELLEERSGKVALAGLELANALVNGDEGVLDGLCLAGALPLVCRLAGSAWPRIIRLQAALFLQHLCQAGRPTAAMLVACQGLPTLVGLVEEGFAENGQLTAIGVNCIWRLLELHAHTPLNHLCRLLASAGLAHRLARTLAAVNAEFAYALAQEGGSSTGFGETGGGGLRKHGSASSLLIGEAGPLSVNGEDFSRLASHSQAASISGATGVTRPPGSASKFGRPPTSPNVVAGPRALPAKLGHQQHRRTTSWGTPSVDLLRSLVDKMANLLLLLSHGDTSVKGWLCRRETLLLLFETMRSLDVGPLLTVLKCLKHLTTDPSMLQPLQDAGTIPALLPYLARREVAVVQLEALQTMYNLCRISRTRQEAAAVAGIIPHLTALAMLPATPADEGVGASMGLRPLAVALLCGMAHSTQRTRHELWSHNGLELLLQLLREEAWQGPALEAMATWLAEDPGRVEARLAHRDSVQRFVALFAAYSGAGASEALARRLDPFLRILRRSPKVAVEVGNGGMAPLVVEMLRHTSALTALHLLQMVRLLYEHQPRPKEFITQHPIAQQLRRLASADNATSSVLVRKQAQNLLDAYQVNMVF